MQQPDEEGRRAIFAVHLRDKPLAPDVTAEELARITPGRSGADIEAICRRASLLALREWIAPKLVLGHVQVTEATDDAEPIPPRPKGTTAPLPNLDDVPPTPSTRFLIRAEHFAQAIEEQRERYSAQEEAEAGRERQERGRQRLLEMASGLDQQQAEKPPLRGFRLWLARFFRLI